MSVDNPGFHAHSGWHFRREEDGSVRVLHAVRETGSLHPDRYETVVFDAATWASIVVAVSAGVGNTVAWRTALDFHNTATPEPKE